MLDAGFGPLGPDALPGARDVLAQSQAENFPVAARFFPAATRAHLMAVYGFARLTDEIGDTVQGDRLAMLDWLESELERAAQGCARHPILVRLTPTIRQFDLGLDPFRRLIEANRADQVVKSYETFEALRGYCELSAAPVGRLVLEIFRAATPERIGWSDDVCVGLQIVDHLQDVGEDARSGRIYLPAEDLRRFNCRPDDLIDDRAGPGVQALIRFEAARATSLLGAGTALARSLHGRQRLAVLAFAGGGRAAIDAMSSAYFDVLGTRCRPRPVRMAYRIATGLATGAARGRGIGPTPAPSTAPASSTAPAPSTAPALAPPIDKGEVT